MSIKLVVVFAALCVACYATSDPDGLTGVRKATREDQAIADKVKDAVRRQIEQNFSKFQVVSVGTQLVAGTNYFMKVNVGGGQYIHIRVFKPLPDQGSRVQLHGVQPDKSEDDPLVYF